METSLAESFAHAASAAVATEVVRAIARAMNMELLRFMDLPLSVA
jgi:hypothetical protein